MEVVVRNNNIEEAILRLKRMVKNSGLIKELKRSSFYETRTQRRRTKDRLALKRTKKNERLRDAKQRLD